MRLASLAIVFAFALPAVASPRVSRRPTSARASRHAKKHPVKAAVPRIMDSGRATQIQTALIAQGYLSGTPTGVWDEQSQAAMVKLQSDNHWQTKLVPDSRAIIKLGLGPGAAQPAPETNAAGDSDSNTFASVSQH